MQNQEQNQEKENFSRKLREFIETEKPENYSLLLFGGEVTENDDEDESLSINAICYVVGKGRALNALITSTMERDPNVSLIISRAASRHRAGSLLDGLKEMLK